MCLGIPGKLTKKDGFSGIVRIGAVETPINLHLTPEARPGDFLLVHAGFALNVMDENAVSEALAIFRSVNRNLARLAELEDEIKDTARGLKPIKLMEVCGTHTVAIARSGIKSRLPDNIDLISGPGCPVCVTPPGEIAAAVDLALSGRAHIVSFGDMIRVPGTKMSLEEARAHGGSVSVVYSPDQALAMARSGREDIVFLAVGFETTAPVIASLVAAAAAEGLDNLSIFCEHRLIPPALDAILSDSDSNLSGLICPGHVSVVIGSDAYLKISEDYDIPCVVSGFEPVDILEAVLSLLKQVMARKVTVENQYERTVTAAGSASAQRTMAEIFSACDGNWRGLGKIKNSALKLRPEFRRFDAVDKYDLRPESLPEPAGCRCGALLSGQARPADCRLFGRDCIPESPVGPCMVSSEGACAAAYLYGG